MYNPLFSVQQIVTEKMNAIFLLGMGRTWQISGRICLPCGKNLSSGHIAKLEKTLKIAKNIKDAVLHGWRKQILENSS